MWREPWIATMKVFVSYSHIQSDWVQDRLVPCLQAGGAEVLIDVERFRPGGAVYRQMDALQDMADRQVLVLSADYLDSAACRHEMERAIARDPRFESHVVQIVRRDDTEPPGSIRVPDPLCVDLRDDAKVEPWDMLMRECGASLGTTAPLWLAARDDVRRKFDDSKSINLIVDQGVRWKPLIDDVMRRSGRSFPLIYMNAGEVVARRGLVDMILDAIGAPPHVRRSSEDLAVLSRAITQRNFTTLGFLNFDFVKGRRGYDKDLHGALRYLAYDSQPRKLQLLVQSHARFAELLPGKEYSSEDFLYPVELKSYH